MSRKTQLGLAVGERRIAAHWVDAAGQQHRSATLIPGEATLDGVLRSLAAILGLEGRVTVSVALLPPLVRARRVSLPPMSAADRALAITRTAGRHFLGLREPVVCVAESDGALVYAASVSTLECVHSSLEANGWRVERIVPAHVTWLRTALGRQPALRTAKGTVSVVTDGEVTSLEIDRGRLTLVRRTATAPEGATLLAADPEGAANEAAAAARSTSDHEFVGPAERDRRASVVRSTSRWLYAAAAAGVVAAAGIHYAGLVRERDALREARAAIAPQVAAAMRARDSLSKLTTVVTAVDRLEQSSARWSAVISRMATTLPRQATLASLRAEGDSVRFDGDAEDAAAVFNALRTAPGVLSLRPSAPIRQEAGTDAKPVERWTITTRVDHRAAVRGNR